MTKQQEIEKQQETEKRASKVEQDAQAVIRPRRLPPDRPGPAGQLLRAGCPPSVAEPLPGERPCRRKCDGRPDRPQLFPW